MKRLTLVVAVLCILGSGLMAQEEGLNLELGLGVFPTTDNGGKVNIDPKSGPAGMDLGIMLHAAWAPAIFIVGVDSFIVPPGLVEILTTDVILDQATQEPIGFTPGYYRPGFVNTISGGLQFEIGPIVLGVQAGINTLYVYKQEELPKINDQLGAHLKVNAGIGFGALRVQLTAISIQRSFQDIVNIFKGLASDTSRDAAVKKLTETIIPALMVVVTL